MVQNDSQINTHVFVMVNGEGPSVPITTLACIQSLTDLPLELPLPTPLPGVTGHQSLLSHLRDSEEARRLLNTPDSIIIPPLIDALDRTTIDHIEVKDGYYGGGSLSGKKSQLVQYLLGRNPSLFKGSVQGPQTSGDHHASSGQWLRKECSNISAHHQQTSFNAPTVSPCQPHQNQGNSLHYYPLEHPPISQTSRIVQNKTPSMPPKSFLTYSPYDHPVASGQQHSVPLHNDIAQNTGDSLPSGLQETPQILNSLVNVPLSSSAVHLFSNGNCVDEVDLTTVSVKQSDITENHILDASQISNIVPNCSPVINDINDVSMSLSSSSAPHVNSSTVIVGSSVPHLNSMKKRAVEQWQSALNNSLEISPSDTSAKENVNSIHNSESAVQLLSVPASESVNESGIIKSEGKHKHENISKPDVIYKKRRVSSTEPVVVLSKFNLEDQLPIKAQKSVCQNTIKSKKTESSYEPAKELVQNKITKISNRHSSACTENTATPQAINSSSPLSIKKSVQTKASENSKCRRSARKESDLNNKSSQEKDINSEHLLETTKDKTSLSPESVKTSIQNKDSENIKYRRSSTSEESNFRKESSKKKGSNNDCLPQATKGKKSNTSEPAKVSIIHEASENSSSCLSSICNESTLINKSRRKDKKVDSPPESAKISPKNQISEKNKHCSSASKQSDTNNKSPRRKSRKTDSSPESVKVSVRNKVSENDNRCHSSTLKEPGISNKSPRRKDRKTDSSPESVKVSVRNKVSENDNRCHSSTLKEPGISNKSPRRKDRKTDSSPESVKVPVRKVSENENRRRSSICNEPKSSNNVQHRKDRKTDSSPESLKVSVQNKVSEKDNRRRLSTHKEPDLGNKAQQRKNRKTDSSSELAKVCNQNELLENSNPQHSTCVTDPLPTATQENYKKRFSEQCESLQNNSSKNSKFKSDTCAKENVNNIHNSKSNLQTSTMPESKPNNKTTVTNELGGKVKNENVPKSTIISEKVRISAAEPVVVLSPLSLEDQLLAQKSIQMLKIKDKKSECKEPELSHKSSERKNRKTDASSEPLKISVQDKVLDNNNHPHSSTCKEPDYDSKSPQSKGKKRYSSPESVKLSLQNEVSENNNRHHSTICKESDLSNKIPQRKDKKTHASPDSAKLSAQNKVAEDDNHHCSSARKKLDLDSKSTQRKDRKKGYCPESVKVSDQDAVSNNSNLRRSSTCNETDKSDKSPQRKSRKTNSSPEPIKVSVNKSSPNSNRRSSTCKEPDLNNKSPQRSNKKINSSPEIVKLSVQDKAAENSKHHSASLRRSRKTDYSPDLEKESATNKVSENSNHRRSSTCKEPDLNNKSPQRNNRKTNSSPEIVKLSVQNKVSGNSKHHHFASERKSRKSDSSPELVKVSVKNKVAENSNKSPQRKCRKTGSSPESVKVCVQDKFLENSNYCHPSTCKKSETNNVSSKRKSNNTENFLQSIKDEVTDCSEKIKANNENEVSEISNRHHASKCKEADISDKSPQRKGSNNEYFPKGRNSKSVNEKGLKRILNSSSEEINKSLTPNSKAKKKSRLSSQSNYIISSNSEDESRELYGEKSLAKPVVLSTPKKKKFKNKSLYTTEPLVILRKLSLKDQLLAQKSVRQFIIKCKANGSYGPLKLPHRRSLNLSLVTINKSSASNAEARKRHKTGSRSNYMESSNSEDENSDESYKEDSSVKAVSAIPKAKRLKNKSTKKGLTPESLSVEELMDSNTYQHFSRTVDIIFDSMDGMDFSAVNDEDEECAAEALIPLTQLQELRNEAAKLKRLHAMCKFPPERLVRLLTILERNIIDGTKLLPVQMLEEQDEDEERLWLQLTMERIIRSADASLTALYIMTSSKMPEKVFLEDVIERIVVYLKYQLQNTIFPVFDPAYRLDPKSKTGYAGNIKQKRAHAHKVKEKSFIKLYNKLHEALSLFAELLELQTVTDTIILHVSALGVSTFFVEGISELQLSALHLVTTVFAHYDKHRSLILEDILSSIARLPTSKRSLRNYRLNSEENIQMLTALVLQLIHCVIRLPESKIESKSEFSSNEEMPKDSDMKEKVYIDKDVLIITSYEGAMKTAVGFLSVFLKKCGTKNEEMDYRPLFENFVQDLLSTVNKPEWPASELLLSVLGRMLVKNFSSKSMEMTLRVASLDYLGVVAARVRKDAIASQDRQDMINDIILRIASDSDDDDSSPAKSKKKKKKKMVKRDEVQILQKALLQYLDSNAANDPALQFSRRFYIAQWYRDVANEVKRSDKSLNFPSEESSEKSNSTCTKSKPNRTKKGRRRSSQVIYEEEEDEEEKEESKLESDEVDAKVLALAEERKRFLLTVIKQGASKIDVKEEKHIDYETAELISHYLASTRHFSKSFDLYLSQILCVLSETAVAVRTKAMKCLTLVVEADPSILARPDMQKGVHGRLLDQSTSVREAAVDLLGKFILIRPELISQYYEMLTARILDTGVSVRKRVIKILKDICLEQPDCSKIPEICVKIIRRVNDEEGIKKLVGEVFQSMWFSPVSDKKQEQILQKVKNIAHVVEACRDTGLEWFEQLLTNLLKNKDDGNYKSVIKSCKQIVDCLVEKLLQLEESSQNVDGGASSHLVACLTTLHLFSKIYPPFVVSHATTIQPYLSMKCNTQSDFLSLKYVAQTLELVVPLIEHPSESFLAQIEEDLVKLILQQHMGLLPSCVSCLGSVVNKVTHNYQFVKDCFQKFFAVLVVCKRGYEKNPENEMLKTMRPKLLRSLYTVGLFCRYFNFDVIDTELEQNGEISIKNKVFESIIYFNQHNDEDIRLKALTGLGFIMIRHYEFMLGPEVKTLYHYLLTSSVASSLLKCQVLKNITNYLVEEEMQMIQKDSDWKEQSKSEDLKEMGDVTSGMASTVIQLYLKQILDCVLHTEVSCRKASLSVIQLILSQGLVHPVQIVPYLVCLGSDDDPVIQTKADQLLQEIEKKYPGFIQMKAMHGVRLSFKMQQLIQNQDEIVRGFRCPDVPVSRNGFLYSLMRSTRQSRRAFLCSLMKLFDEQDRTPLIELLYIADNIAYFSYMAQDEPLFIMHQLDIMLSVSGSNLLQTFRETLSCRQSSEASEQNTTHREVDDDDDDDFETILKRVPEATAVLQECIIASQGCILLLCIKQTLKEMYGFTDNKIQQYSPNETAKVYERPLNRKGHVRFNPETVLNFVKMGELKGELDDQGKEKLVKEYLHFKQLMLTIDPADDDDDEKDSQAKPETSTHTVSPVPDSTGKTVVNENRDETKPVQLPQEETKVVTSRKCKSPTHSRSHRKLPKTPKEKVKKKHKKKRKRILISASEDSASDPDYMDSS